MRKDSNMEDLYSEILYNFLHIKGKDADKSRPPFFKYLQEAFGVELAKHECLLEAAKMRKAPDVYLSVTVIEAKVRKPTDVNGLSDPYCVLYLASKETESCHTTVQFETLNPTWNETFQFPIDNPEEEVLCLEVWDYDADETVGEKVKKIKEIRNVQGLKVYFKEVSLTVSSARKSVSTCHELIGSALISLKNIPSSGETHICKLDKNGKVKKQGDLKVHTSFCLRKDTSVSFEEHRYLLHNVILHELKSWQDDLCLWSGDLSTTAKSLVIHHQEQCNISSLHVKLAEWIEYVHIHEHHPLNLSIFLSLIEKLVKPLEENLFRNEEKKLFWEAVTKLLPSCLMAIGRIQVLSLSDKTVKHPLIVFKILCQLAALAKSSYNWLTVYENPKNYTINSAVEESVSEGANEWFSQLLERNYIDASSDEEEQLRSIINVIETILVSLEKTLMWYEGTFKECFHFSYAEILYKIYERNIAAIVEPIVSKICKSMKPLKFNDSSEGGVYDNDPLTVGSALFLVYTNLRKFVELGKDICNGNADLLLPNKFHHWFHPALVQWLYICEYKAKHRIQKAVELDHFDKSSQLGSSAVDVLGICEEIKIFWKELAWPETQTSYVLLTRIIEDVCECLSFYSIQMVEKARKLISKENQNETDDEFQAVKEWCLTVKNVHHIQHLIPNFLKGFKMEEVITSAAEVHNSLAAEDWTCSIKTVINRCTEGYSTKTTNMMENFTHKVMSTVSSHFLNAIEHHPSSHTDKLMKYVDDHLYLLHKNLPPEHFNEIIRIMWRSLSQIMHIIAEGNLNMKKQPSFYTNIQDHANKLLEYFTQIPISTDLDMTSYVRLMQLLELNASSTQELIHYNYLEQVAIQKKIKETSYGLLTVRLQFLENILRIEVLNARHLLPICPKGNCNPYVKVCLLPQEKYTNVVQPKTSIKHKTIFPLFDEQFTIILNKEQRNVKNAIVMFTVKHNVHLGTDPSLGEALLSFQDIPVFNNKRGFENLEQIHLKLCRPIIQGSEIYRILKNREDKTAKEFIEIQNSLYTLE